MPPEHLDVRATTTWDTAPTVVSHHLPVFFDGIFLVDLRETGQHQSRAGWCLSLMAAALRWNLFVYRDLREWLDDPTSWNAEPPSIAQLNLPIPGFGQQIG